MAWTLKELKEFIDEVITEDNENEIVYLSTGRYFGALQDGEILLESDLKD